MPFNTITLVVCLSVVGTILSASTASAAELEFPPESHLARGLFQLAVINREETRLLTATANLAQLWDLKTGAMLQQYEGHAATIHSVCFSPDERQVLTSAGKAVEHGPDDSMVRLWDVASGKQLAVFTTAGHPEFDMSSSARMISARFTPDNQQVLAVSRSSTGIPDCVILWNRKTQNMDLVVSGISTLSGVTHTYEPGLLSPDGRWFVGLYAEGLQVRSWDARTGQVRWQNECPDHPLPKDKVQGFGSVQVSGDGKMVLAACSDKSVRIWDAETGRELQTLKGHTDDIRVARFSPNAEGEQVLTASHDGTVRLWEPRSGQQLKQWDHPGPVQEMSISPSGHRILTRWIKMDKTNQHQWFARLWDTTNGRMIHESELPPMWKDFIQAIPLNAYRSSVMSPSGRLVLTPIWTDGEVKVTLVDAETGTIRQRFESHE